MRRFLDILALTALATAAGAQVPMAPGRDTIRDDRFFSFYDRGPYRRGAVDYGRDPEPLLDSDDLQWVYQQLREHGLRS